MEINLLRSAPYGAKRTSKRVLEISWSNGKRAFADEPPFDEPLDGVRWTYCGYSPSLKMHLIEKDDGALFTGVILNDVTGDLEPGGLQVLFSSDHRYYLTYEMVDGAAAETLKLFSRNGGKLWQGNNGFMDADGSRLFAFRKLRWTDPERVRAEAVPSNGARSFSIELAPRAAGRWEWNRIPRGVDSSFDPAKRPGK